MSGEFVAIILTLIGIILVGITSVWADPKKDVVVRTILVILCVLTACGIVIIFVLKPISSNSINISTNTPVTTFIPSPTQAIALAIQPTPTILKNTPITQSEPTPIPPTVENTLTPIPPTVENTPTLIATETAISILHETPTSSQKLVSGESNVLIRASQLSDYTVLDQNLEYIGKLNDLIINIEDRRVYYVTMQSDDLLGFGGKVFPVPLQALKIPEEPIENPLEENVLILIITKEGLESAPNYDINWPNPTNPNFDDIQGFWKDIGMDVPINNPASTDIYTVKTSILLGYNIKNNQGENLGKITDLLFDLKTSEVSYITLEFGGFLGLGDSLYIIPINKFQFTSQNRNDNPMPPLIILNVNSAILSKAPVVELERFPDTTVDGWDTELRKYWTQL